MKSCLVLIALFVWARASMGCAHSAEERQLQAMRDEIDNIRDSRDGADRDSAAREAMVPGMVVPPAYASGAAARARPTVVQLGEGSKGPGADNGIEGSAENADPQDTTPRPSIRVLGGGRGSGRTMWRAEEVVEQNGSEDQPAADATPREGAEQPHGMTTLDPDAKRAYDASMLLVNSKRYDEALDALARFLVKWPDHPYANNAMYWRGECYFAKGDYAHAAEQFEGVLARFPAGSKVPDALLKLGMSHQRLGNSAKTKECFDRLAQQFPDSEAARRLPAAARGPARELAR